MRASMRSCTMERWWNSSPVGKTHTRPVCCCMRKTSCFPSSKLPRHLSTWVSSLTSCISGNFNPLIGPAVQVAIVDMKTVLGAADGTPIPSGLKPVALDTTILGNSADTDGSQTSPGRGTSGLEKQPRIVANRLSVLDYCDHLVVVLGEALQSIQRIGIHDGKVSKRPGGDYARPAF